MNDETSRVTPELQHHVEQFYYREARLLDSRQYQSWLTLVDPAISYSMPGRSNPLVDYRDQGDEGMISVDRELENVESEGLPIRDESYVLLYLRVDRAYKRNSWADNPPARTRRIVGNVEIIGVEDDRLSVLNSFHLFYARPGSADAFYAGQRRDTLLRAEDDYRILKREIIMDMADINVPNLGLFL